MPVTWATREASTRLGGPSLAKPCTTARTAPSHTRARTAVAVNLGGRRCLIQLRFTCSISALAAVGEESEYLMRSESWGRRQLRSQVRWRVTPGHRRG